MSKTHHAPTHAYVRDLRAGTNHWVPLTGLRHIKPGTVVTDRMGSLYVKAVR